MAHVAVENGLGFFKYTYVKYNPPLRAQSKQNYFSTLIRWHLTREDQDRGGDEICRRVNIAFTHRLSLLRIFTLDNI